MDKIIVEHLFYFIKRSMCDALRVDCSIVSSEGSCTYPFLLISDPNHASLHLHPPRVL